MTLRVLMIGDFPEPGTSATGGVAAAVEAVVPELAKLVDLTIAVPGANQDLSTRAAGVPVIYLKRAPGPGVLRYWTADALRVRRVAKVVQPDLVHVQGSGGSSLWVAPPIALTVHGIPHLNAEASRHWSRMGRMTATLRSRLTRAVEWRARQHARNIVVINDYVLEELPDVRALRTARIPNPVHSDFITEKRQVNPEGHPVLLAVGRVEAAKGVREAIELTGALKARIPSVKLRWCGPTPDLPYLDGCVALADELGISASVVFTGALGRRALIGEVDRAAGLLIVSRQETAPMVVGEALARGTPVFGPRKFGLASMISPGTNGAFLPGGDPDIQAALLFTELARPWDRDAIAQAAFSQYSPEMVARQLVKFYGEIVSGKTGTGI